MLDLLDSKPLSPPFERFGLVEPFRDVLSSEADGRTPLSLHLPHGLLCRLPLLQEAAVGLKRGWGFRVRVLGLGFRVLGLGFRV